MQKFPTNLPSGVTVEGSGFNHEQRKEEEWRRNGGLSDLDLAGGVGEGHDTHGEGSHDTDHVQASVGGSHWTGEQEKEKGKEDLTYFTQKNYYGEDIPCYEETNQKPIRKRNTKNM